MYLLENTVNTVIFFRFIQIPPAMILYKNHHFHMTLGALYREEDVRCGCDHICSTIYIATIHAKMYQNHQHPGLHPRPQ